MTRLTRFDWPRGAARAALLALTLCSPPAIHAEESCSRIMAQDSTLNNLVDPPGYRTAPLGTLGEVRRAGLFGPTMILIPGLGFGADVFATLMDSLSESHRLIAVTLPGFAGTAAPPSPPKETSFGDQTWTRAAMAAIEKLIVDEKIERPILVGHWLTGTQIALRLAMKHPDRIRGVVLLAGAPRMTVNDTVQAKWYATPERRVKAVDKALAPYWFRTVTRETWDDNNFLPDDYAVNPVRALRLWREAARPPLHVWVRYLCEFNAQDITFEMDRLRVPTLLLRPGLEGLWHQPGQNYMDGFCRTNWATSLDGHSHVTVQDVPDSRACLWFDQPAAVTRAIERFADRLR